MRDVSPEYAEVLQQMWREEAWRRGDLRWILRPNQKPVFDDIKRALWGDGGYLDPSGTHKRFMVEIARRFGKSVISGAISCELCIQKPGARVDYGAMTSVQVEEILLPNMDAILATCPEELRPEWMPSKNKWVFPRPQGYTGQPSQIKMVGCEDERKANRLRGPGSDLVIPDEGGFIDALKYLVSSIAVPQTIDRNGRILIPSSPAKSPGHYFNELAAKAEISGNYAHRTAHQSDLTKQQIRDFCEEIGGCMTCMGLDADCADCGGEGGSTEWQREGMAKRVVDEDLAIVAEFTPRHDAIVRPMCVACGEHFDSHKGVAPVAGNLPGEWMPGPELCADGGTFEWEVKRPQWYDIYTCMDVGWSPDLTAVGFSYWDMGAATHVWLDELTMGRMTTEDLNRGIACTEERLWGDYWQYIVDKGLEDEIRPEPYMRVSDNDLQVIADMAKLHDMAFAPTQKHNKESAINQLKLMVKGKAGEMRIHPRCRDIRAHLRAGIWNKGHTSYARVDGFGHFDHVDQMVYQVRNIDRDHDPTPALNPHNRTDDQHVPARVALEEKAKRDGLADIFS